MTRMQAHPPPRAPDPRTWPYAHRRPPRSVPAQRGHTQQIELDGAERHPCRHTAVYVIPRALPVTFTLRSSMSRCMTGRTTLESEPSAAAISSPR